MIYIILNNCYLLYVNDKPLIIIFTGLLLYILYIKLTYFQNNCMLILKSFKILTLIKYQISIVTYSRERRIELWEHQQICKIPSQIKLDIYLFRAFSSQEQFFFAHFARNLD